MGAILTTPTKSGKGETNFEPNNNNLKQNILNEKHNHQESKKSVPFSKMNIVQECFPAFTGKDNKFLNEKVPSYWSKTSNRKKNKQKLFNDTVQQQQQQQQQVLNKENVAPKPKTSHEPINVIPSTDDKHKLTLCKIQHNPDKHFYGTLNLSETLKYIGCYVYLRCRNLEGLKPSIVVGWIRSVDRNLVLSGWQEMAFISQPNMMVLYMLLREVIPPKVRSLAQLKALMMSTLYMCYAYNGHEISYPLKPFLFDGDRAGFWDRCMEIINQHSDKLLQINKEPKMYNEIQLELKTFGRSLERKDR
ncbi:cyclin-dependent kinase 5 activator 1-like [Clytia hemisphaerica]|uniref:cyclin-dependent kinase 5 activator 1-like n=1 Tax=Clytia hemisphaerica TaxID=252671 RepID=UPI0034D6CE8D